MKLIATHDSATGEKGKGILSWLGTPFAKTQSKTIKEQYEAGCRMFDIRVKLIDNEWYCAHGLWRTKRTAYDKLEETMPDYILQEYNLITLKEAKIVKSERKGNRKIRYTR